MTRSVQRGFTLVELMTVVFIIGILAAIAVPNLRNTADVESTARNIASQIGEAARTAIGRGPVPFDVAQASASAERVRVNIFGSEPYTMEVRLQVETGPASSAWYTIQQTTLPRGIRVAGESLTADLTGGAAIDNPTVGFGCNSNGQCDPRTIYITNSDGAGNDKFRIVIMPLSTAPYVLRGW